MTGPTNREEGAMSAAALLSRDPGGEGFTVADLHALPDGGPRYELIDGSIIVSPSATHAHNIVARWFANALDEARPSDEYVVGTDQSTVIDEHNELRPDVDVARARALETTPFPISDLVLAVEVVSPKSSWLRDTETKRALYARAGVPSYWIVVPEDDAPTIAVAELVLDEQTGQYAYRTHYTTDVFTAERPWPVTIDLPAMTARRARLLEQASKGAGPC
ncbi:MAG: Uma2 family endonuclease [Actinomycetota bacterium]